jgi:hypothetical protein
LKVQHDEQLSNFAFKFNLRRYTMARSAKPLYILGFLLGISLVMFSSVMYYAERGSYDTTVQQWMRTTVRR